MQKVKTLLTASAIAAAATLTAPAAMAEVEASVGASSLYLFRGMDIGDGAQLFGDLTVSEAGFYASVWGSSAGEGGEYDLITGYSTEVGGVAVGLGVINYIYPSDDSSDSVGDFSEAFLTLGFGDVELTYWNNIAGLQGDEYITLGYTCDSWSFVLGHSRTDHNGDVYDSGLGFDSTEREYTHFDISYAVTDNLSFTVSKVIDRKAEGTSGGTTVDAKDVANAAGPGFSEKDILDLAVGDDDTLFVVSYSLPIEIK